MLFFFFGWIFATAALPTLSSEWSGKKIEEFKSTFVTNLHNIIYLALPTSVLLAVLRIPIVRLVLGSGLFDWPATVATATTLSFFAVGIFAQSGFFLVTRAFYAMHDTTTPLRVALASLALHIVVSSLFVIFLARGSTAPVAYLALAASFSSLFSFLMLFWLLERRVGGFGSKRFLLPILKIVTASFVMGLLLYLPLHLRIDGKFVIDYIIDTRRAVNLLFLTGFVASVGLSCYLLLTWWFKSEELANFTRLIPDLSKLGKELIYEEPVDSTHATKS